ncbi:MAG TPA: alpha/beta fold hydrolase [Solirubrobacterales bacterium]
MRKGSGERLLLLHGLGGSTAVWSPVIDSLAEEREVLAIDLPGFGGASPLPAGVEPHAVNLAVAVREACAELGFERPHVAGNSLGGWVALELGRAGWAASVTAISPAGLWRKPLGDRRANPRLWAKRLRPFVSLALRTPWARETMLATFSARPDRIPAREGRDLVLGWIDSSGYDGANRAMRTHVFDPTGYPDLPVTLAWGDRDRLLAPPRPERRPAGSRYVVLRGVGHTPTWDDPELVAATLLEGSSVSAAV